MQVELVKKHEAKITIVCMTLLALAAGYVLMTRPAYRIEGDFLAREDRGVVDEWLLSQLEVTVAEQRARACLSLGRIGDPATLPYLLQALKDHAPSVRAAAAFAVGVMEDPQLAQDPSRQLRREAADALLSVLEDEERAVVANAVEALGKLGFADVAERLTATPAPYPVTLTALVRLRAMELVPWIAERLKSDDQDNRWAAALALNELDAPLDDGIARSFVNLTKDREMLVRIEAVKGLGRAQASQKVPLKEVFDILVRMTSDSDPKVRMAALESLGMLRQPGTLEVLVESLHDRNENVIAAAIRGMAALGDRRAIDVLDGLGTRTSAVSHEAEAALAKLSGRAAVAQGEAEPAARMQRAEPSGPRYETQDYQRLARTIGHRVRMETSAGPIEIALDYRNAALTAEYFVELAEKGGLNGARIVDLTPYRYLGVAVSPSETPGGNDEQQGEGSLARPVPPEINGQPFLRGSLGMDSDALNAAGLRFFICLTPQPLANGRNTNFGRLVLGDDLLDAITVETRILKATVVE